MLHTQRRQHCSLSWDRPWTLVTLLKGKSTFLEHILEIPQRPEYQLPTYLPILNRSRESGLMDKERDEGAAHAQKSERNLAKAENVGIIRTSSFH